MQLRLHSGRDDLHDPYVVRLPLPLPRAVQLRPQRPRETVHGGFGGAIVGRLRLRREREARAHHDDPRGRGILRDEEGKEVRDHVDHGEVVGAHLVVQIREGDGCRVGEVYRLLEACVQKDAVQRWICGGYSVYEGC